MEIAVGFSSKISKKVSKNVCYLIIDIRYNNSSVK